MEEPALGRLGRLALAYLVVERHRPISHAELAELLWGEDLPRSWEQLVRGTVAKLRAAFRDVGLLPTDVLTTGFGCYQIHLPAATEVDVEAAAGAVEASNAALAAGDVDRAGTEAAHAALIASRQFVPGGVGPWVERRQAELRELHLRALEAHADAAIAATDWASAIDAAEKAIAFEPFRESSYQRLMAAHAGIGNLTDALRAYDRCRRALAEDLGVNPSPSTEAAYLELLGGEAATTSPSPPDAIVLPLPPGYTNAERSPFVGREGDLATVEGAFERARSLGVQAILVAGEPGIGKTRLAMEVGRMLHAAGVRVLHGRCDDELAMPYQPFAEALRQYVLQAPADELAAHVATHGGAVVRLVPELNRRLPDLPPPPSADDETDRYRMFEAVVAMLSDAAGHGGLLLVLDDLHWAAKPTLLLLRHLLRSNTHAQVLVLATYRDNELAWSHPLAELLADLRQSSCVERVLLWGLDPESVAALLKPFEGKGGLVSDGALVERLYADTDGNPFFVGELIRHLIETGDHQLGVPQGVREVVRRRLARLDPATGRALSVAAVTGQEFSLALVEHAAIEGDDVLAALEQAAAAGLVVERVRAPGRFQFAHALIRRAVYEDLGATRRARLHLAVARAVQSLAANDDSRDVMALALHFCQAVPEVDAATAADYAARASRQAFGQLAYEDAVHHAERGLSALEQSGEPETDRRCTLLLLVGAARMRMGDNEGMRAACLAAAVEARILGDAERFGQAVAMHNFLLPKQLKRSGAELVEEALLRLDHGFPAVRAQVMAARACDMLTHREAQVEAAAREALELARASGDPDALWRALLVFNCSLWGNPRINERLAVADEFMARSAPGWHRAHAHRIRTITRYVAGDLAGALDDAREMGRLGAELRMPGLVELGQFAKKLRATLDGDFSCLDDEHFTPHPSSFDSLLLQAFEVGRAQGRLPQWLPTLEELVDASVGERAFRAQRTLAYALTGRRIEARNELDCQASEDIDSYWGWTRPHCWAYLGEAAAVLGERGHVTTMAARLRPYGGQLIGPSCCPGSADRYLGVFAAARQGWAEAEAYFEGAVAFESRLGAPLLLSRTRLAFAQMLIARDAPGDSKRAAAHLTAALDETAALDMAGLRAEAADLLACL